MRSENLKILFGGGLFGKEALCYMGREMVKQLQLQGHQVNIDCPKIEGYWEKFFNNFEGPEDVYILNSHITSIPELARTHKAIIPVVTFETTLPQEWVEALKTPEIKQIWTISQFCKQLTTQTSLETPVNVVYLGIDERFHKKRANLFPKDKSFKFLHVSAPHAIGLKDRKGLDILIKAFKEEFSSCPGVTLILKLNLIYAEKFNKSLGKRFDIQEYLRSMLPPSSSAGNIQLLTQYLEVDQLNDLYNSVDCGVFPSRAEGWGWPQIEMASIGLPVITSDYGATNEFSDPHLRIKLDGMTKLDYNVYPYNDSLFAEPSVEDLRKLLRLAYSNETKEVELAVKHAETVKTFTWNQTGWMMNDFLALLPLRN